MSDTREALSTDAPPLVRTQPTLKKFEERLEFGGPRGTFAIMIISHVLLYYLWIAIAYYKGHAPVPESFADVGPYFGRLWGHIVAGATPTWRAAAIYFGFLGFQLGCAYVMPGVKVKGLPVPSEGNRQREYLCNGYVTWLVTLATAAALHFSGVFRLTEWADNLGPMLTVAVIFGNLVSIYTYVATIRAKREIRMTGHTVYDFFMGAILNPFVGKVDMKMFVEIRVSWILLFFLTASAAAKQFDLYGTISWPMIFMLTAHGLYTNACMKGEESIPTTWDIFYEKWGWMLIFWNLVGVPMVYCFNSYYILQQGAAEYHHPAFMGLLFFLLFGAYYVWDTSMAQKNRYRAMERGLYIKRNTFPQMPWGTLKYPPKLLKTANGGSLLIDGFWAYARKIHYAADIVMASCWALACGFDGILPYLYPCFFFVMIMHRASRDEARCKEKYGEDWDRYTSIVKYRFIPFVI